MDNTAIRSTPT